MSQPPKGKPLLDVQGLTVHYHSRDGSLCVAVNDASFQVARGEILGIFGESGSGKTTLGLALLGLLPQAGNRTADRIRFQGRDLMGANDSTMRRIRGNEISIMYQEPALALNPVMRIGDQIAEVIRAHQTLGRRECRERATELLHAVRLGPRSGVYTAYPHELSGGERHRVVIAQALACHPSLVIADEPTSGLDATLQLEIIDLLEGLRAEFNVSLLLISHDRKLLARIGDRVLYMSAGRISGSEPAQVSPRRFSAASVNSLADHERFQVQAPAVSPDRNRSELERHHSTSTTAQEPLVALRGICKSYARQGLMFRSRSAVPVLKDVWLEIPRNSTVALVGESGSGKSTLARCLALWEKPESGEIWFQGRNLAGLSSAGARQIRPRIQMVLQDAAAALSPNLTAQEILEEPLLIQRSGNRQLRRDHACELMQEVGLRPEMLRRRPLEFSGGQRQRLAIARALIVNPDLIIFDESTSGLDGDTQRQLVDLLSELKISRHATYLLISHDLDLVRDIADHVAIMHWGTIVESAPAAELFRRPQHVRTRELLAARSSTEFAMAEVR